METILLMFDTAAILAVVYYSLRNEKRPADTAEEGPFRMTPPRRPEPARPAPRTPRRPRIRGL